MRCESRHNAHLTCHNGYCSFPYLHAVDSPLLLEIIAQDSDRWVRMLLFSRNPPSVWCSRSAPPRVQRWEHETKPPPRWPLKLPRHSPSNHYRRDQPLKGGSEPGAVVSYVCRRSGMNEKTLSHEHATSWSIQETQRSFKMAIMKPILGIILYHENLLPTARYGS